MLRENVYSALKCLTLDRSIPCLTLLRLSLLSKARHLCPKGGQGDFPAALDGKVCYRSGENGLGGDAWRGD